MDRLEEDKTKQICYFHVNFDGSFMRRNFKLSKNLDKAPKLSNSSSEKLIKCSSSGNHFFFDFNAYPFPFSGLVVYCYLSFCLGRGRIFIYPRGCDMFLFIMQFKKKYFFLLLLLKSLDFSGNLEC